MSSFKSFSLSVVVGIIIAGAAFYVYQDLATSILCFIIIPLAHFCTYTKDKSAFETITHRVADDPKLLALKREQILEELSILESARTLQSTVFEASTELVGLSDENDARERFMATLQIYWSSAGLDLFVWERGVWTSLGGEAFGDEPMLTGPVQLPDTKQKELILDLSPGVDGQAAVILRNAKPQPTIANRSISDQRYIADVLRGQLVLSLRRVKLYNRLQELGRTDPLTTVTRRWYGIERLEELIKSRETACIAMVDIDYFKNINDNHGHQTGDLVLKTVGGVLNKTLRTGDIACRYGGEEFLLLLPRASAVSGRDVAERIRAKIATLADLPCEVTVSVGVTDVRPTDNADSIIGRADAALYYAKENGRNQVVLADETTEVHSYKMDGTK